MHARVVRVSIGTDPVQIEAGVQHLRTTVVPSVGKAPGVKHGYWLLNRQTGEGLGVILFEDEAALRAAQARSGDEHGMDGYEVIAEL